MSQTPSHAEQPKGNFAAFLNREKVPGDDRPLFIDGKISKPGDTNELSFVLWPFHYTDRETGEVCMGFQGEIGNVSLTGPAMDQLESLLKAQPKEGTTLEANGVTLKPRRIVAFANKPKDGGAENQKTHYAYVNFGDGSPIVDASIWLKKDRNGRAMLGGNTQWSLTPEQKAALKGTPEPVPSLTKFEPNPAADGKKRTGRGGRGE